MSTWIGKTLGKVHIDSLIARGGMAVVYLGTHTTLQREVVVKILRNDFEEDTAALERFEREAQVVAKLRHQNIVQVFDFDTIEDQPYIVMEYIAGPSLSKYLNTLHEKIGRLELPQVSRLLTKVASALQYAHDSGVIHRDVKPANILLTSRSSQIVSGEPLPLDFEPVLTDFGLVRFLSSSLQTSSGKIVGTPAYMSPEQARGEHTDERTDIYSLGIVLYEMLAGHVPFDGETTMSILLKHINEPPAPVLGLSAPLQDVLDRALAKNTADRFQTPNEFAEAFNAVMDERSIANTVELAAPRTISPARKTNQQLRPQQKWIPSALAGVITIATAAFLLLNSWAPFQNKTATASPTIEAPVVSDTDTPVSLISVPLGPTGVLRFHDGTAILDQVTLTALAMPAPPEGSQYRVWLVGPDEERLSLGILVLDENGKGSLTFDDSQNQNLLAIYDSVEVIVQRGPDSDPDGIERVAYSYTLPEAGLEYVRQLLVSFPLTPEQVALIQGMDSDTKLIDRAAKKMLIAFKNEDESSIHKNAETIMNLLVGSQSQEYKDWNGDRQTTDPGSGYGFMLNADNLGYIQAVYSHADYAANSPGASQNMIVNGESVKTCARNLAQWVRELQDRILTILKANSLSEMDGSIRDSAALADKMLNGTDEDHNGKIEPISDECGVLTTYEYTYHMADMPLLPVNLLETPTATNTPFGFIRPTITSTRSSNTSQNTPVPTVNNPTDNPGNNPNPTRRPPRPTKTPKK
jgi:tRNA A-37 threonylcarbamoyl transferase component Bud32